MNRLRQIVLGIWILCVVAGIGYYLAHRGDLTKERIADFFRLYQSWFLLIYWVMLIVRAVVLLPATPLILAASMLLPGDPSLVLGVTMFGMAVSSTIIYYFSDWLGVRAHFDRVAPRQVKNVEGWFKHRYGVVLVGGCAFFIVVPTDLVCYVAGMVRMPFRRFICALMVGETLLCTIYIFWLPRVVLW
jgi:uncharacterized membrane protein YdjX (TVP38/TMEM64 family)